jgi:chromosome partitioning protein
MIKNVISVINQKGGVGKTTITVNLSYELSMMGKRILVIDLDPQAHTSCIFVPTIDKNKTIAQAFTEKSKGMSDLVQESYLGQEERKQIDNLFIIPSAINLALASEQVGHRLYREKILKNHLQTIAPDYDYVLIDCPPTLGVLVINAIYASSVILTPVNDSRYALDGMADLLQSIKDIKEDNPYKILVVRSQHDKRNSQTNKYIEQELAPFHNYLLNTILRKNEAINQSQINRVPVQAFDPMCNGSQDFKHLAEEIIKNV